jgi:hypothetical protein
VGPLRVRKGFIRGGDHQLDRLVTIGGERGEGSDKRELCGMQKDPTISQEAR